MEMTIKQLADQLGVSKTTISKAISALRLQGELKRSGNKYLLSDVQIEMVKSQIENQKTQTVSKKTQIQVQKSQPENQELQTEYQNLRFQDQKALIEVLQKQLALLNEQLGIKDDQIRAYQEQIRILTDSLHDATTALSAEQALHAGTIQRQIAERSSSKEDVSPEEQTQQKQKQSFLSRIFEKKRSK